MQVIQVPINSEEAARAILDAYSNSTNVSAIGYYRDGLQITTVAINHDDDDDTHGYSIGVMQESNEFADTPLTELVKTYFERSFGGHIEFVVYAPEIEGVEIPDLQFTQDDGKELIPVEVAARILPEDVLNSLGRIIGWFMPDEVRHFAEGLPDAIADKLPEDESEFTDAVLDLVNDGHGDQTHILIHLARVDHHLSNLQTLLEIQNPTGNADTPENWLIENIDAFVTFDDAEDGFSTRELELAVEACIKKFKLEDTEDSFELYELATSAANTYFAEHFKAK